MTSHVEVIDFTVDNTRFVAIRDDRAQGFAVATMSETNDALRVSHTAPCCTPVGQLARAGEFAREVLDYASDLMAGRLPLTTF